MMISIKQEKLLLLRYGATFLQSQHPRGRDKEVHKFKASLEYIVGLCFKKEAKGTEMLCKFK